MISGIHSRWRGRLSSSTVRKLTWISSCLGNTRLASYNSMHTQTHMYTHALPPARTHVRTHARAYPISNASRRRFRYEYGANQTSVAVSVVPIARNVTNIGAFVLPSALPLADSLARLHGAVGALRLRQSSYSGP